MKKRLFAFGLAMLMVLSTVMPQTVIKAKADEFAGYVYFTVEKVTLGQGFVVEPVKVGFYETDTLADITERVLGDMSTYEGDISSYYLEGVIDGGEPAGWTTADIPEEILDACGGEEELDERYEDDVLAAFDYYFMSGWMFSLNDEGIAAGAGSYYYNDDTYSYTDGDVVRLQFSVYGWGMDINTYDPSWGFGDPLIDLADKDELIKAVADYDGDKSSDAYANAMAVLCDWAADEEDVVAAIEALSVKNITVNVCAYDYTAVAAGLEGASETGVIMETSVTVPEGTEAKDAVIKAFEEAGVSQSGAEYAYVSAINGLDAEAGGGYSGWCLNYNNDDYANWGLSYITLADGDTLRFDYSVNADYGTDDIGNGWYGLPIINWLTLNNEGGAYMYKSTSYDASYNTITDYYINDEFTSAFGTADDPFVINVDMPAGTDLTAIEIDYETSLNEHYAIVEGLETVMDYTDGVEFSVSSLGGTFKSYFKIVVNCEECEHEWDEGVVTKEATPDEAGEMLYTCGICGDTRTEEIEYVAPQEPQEPETQENNISLKAENMRIKALYYVHTNVNDPVISTIGGDWAVLDLARGEIKDEDWYTKYYENVIAAVEENGSPKLSNSKSSENSRVIIGLTSIGADPEDVAGHNLLEPLADFNYVTKQGLNGGIYALIALDTNDYEVPQAEDGAVQTTREGLIEYILGYELENGGWALFGNAADVDMTAMAIQALAPYYESNSNVKAAIQRAIVTLSSMQQSNGGYAAWGSESSESIVQVVCALCALGINPETDQRFVKNGNSVLDALLAYYDEESGAFKHVLDSEVNQMATEQAAYALDAYFRLNNSMNSLYDMSDSGVLYRVAEESVPEESTEAVEESTEAAEESTEAVEESTEAVEESTEAPAESTEAVVESTEVPAESTAATAESTAAQTTTAAPSTGVNTGDGMNAALYITIMLLCVIIGTVLAFEAKKRDNI